MFRKLNNFVLLCILFVTYRFPLNQSILYEIPLTGFITPDKKIETLLATNMVVIDYFVFTFTFIVH